MAAIKREALDAGRVDLSDVVDRTAAPLPPVRPGQVLRGEFLEPLELSAGALVRAIGVRRNRLTGIINGKRTVTADTALRLGIYFGTSAEFWLSLLLENGCVDLSSGSAFMRLEEESCGER